MLDRVQIRRSSRKALSSAQELSQPFSLAFAFVHASAPHQLVMSLSRLWQQQGKKAEAVRRLAEIYDWFTEGFDTADLQDAKSLLAELH